MIDVAGIIDHTALKADTSKDSIRLLCEEAKANKFKAVCVNPTYVRYCSELLKDTEVKVATVIGFPLGANTPQTKAFETKDAIAMGAHEVDMVINIGALKDGNLDLVRADIEAVVVAADKKALVKVIIETALLTDDEKKMACQIAMEAGADYVKTSTGFSTGGATLEDVRLMRSVVGDKLGVKASGGVKDYKTAVAMMEAGATRIGTSSGVEIVKG
ncbi:deoxyribose-phosphate aldolase [Gudongella sp. SC589]|uniref:deoxyribose-phosphate aldolase n=1 Tax=Gudongella sp. SC589 TaxID=3385990 RepID=UPI0039047512